MSKKRTQVYCIDGGVRGEVIDPYTILCTTVNITPQPYVLQLYSSHLCPRSSVLTARRILLEDKVGHAGGIL